MPLNRCSFETINLNAFSLLSLPSKMDTRGLVYLWQPEEVKLWVKCFFSMSSVPDHTSPIPF